MSRKSVWFAVFFDFHRTKTLRTLLLSMMIAGAYAFACDYMEEHIFHIDFRPPTYIYSILGIVLGLLLVFRTNTAYDRWWEGRKLLSKLGYNWKNLAIKINSFLPDDDIKNRDFFSKMIYNHAVSLKEHLREGVKYEELEEIEPGFVENLKTKEIYHLPTYILTLISDRITKLYREKTVSDMQFLELSKHIDDANEVISSCERIHTTPIPFSYAIHLKKFLFVFMLILPFGFIHDLGPWSIAIVMLIFYAMVGLDVIGEEIEDPFGQDENDLPFDGICKSLRKSVREILKIA